MAMEKNIKAAETTEMPSISLREMLQVLEHVVIGQHEAVMFEGGAGSGKTSVIQQWTADKGAHLCKVLLGQYDTVDLRGMPGDTVIEGYETTIWRPASTLPFKGNPNFPTDRPIVLFLDEFTSTQLPVMGLSYQLVDERRIGEHELMENVYIVCAGNRVADKGIVNRMPLPLCNRLTWFEIVINADDLCMHFQSKYGSKALVHIGWFQFHKANISLFDPKDPKRIFASPRTWEKHLKYYISDMPLKIKQAAMAGAIGVGESTMFWGFHDGYAQIMGWMPKIEKNPDTAPIPEGEKSVGLQYALSVALADALTPKNADHLNKYLMRLPADFCVLCWQLAVARKDKDDHGKMIGAQLIDTDAFLAVCKKYKAIFQPGLGA